MRLKTRLFLTFITLTVIPIIIAFSIMFLLSYFNIKNIEKAYQIDSKGLEIIISPVQYFSRLTDEAYAKLYQIATIAPEKLADTKYLEEINNELVEKESFLLVEKNSQIMFGK